RTSGSLVRSGRGSRWVRRASEGRAGRHKPRREKREEASQRVVGRAPCAGPYSLLTLIIKPSLRFARPCPIFGRLSDCWRAGGVNPPLASIEALLFVELRVQLEHKLLEADFHRSAGVQLQREEAPFRPWRVVDVNAQFAVEIRPDLAANGDDLIVIPFVWFDVDLPRFVPEQATAVLLV